MKTPFLVGLFLFPWLAFAVGTDPASISVSVVDQELETPLEGVRLEISGTANRFFTDAQGLATVTLPASDRLLLVAQLPGYETKKLAVKPGEHVVVKLLLSGVVEGHELVVEREKPQKSDSQPGVSQSVSKQKIKDTAKIGIVEDALNSINTLPGVGYTRSFGGRPSIRGGDPNETTATLDGAYVLYPYHWGGAYSIFNPDMVDSVKLSDGILSARYGQVLSGLLEVNSVVPDQQQTHWDLGMSTIGTDFFLQTPLTNNVSLLLGGKVTDLTFVLNAVGAGGVFSQAPYIREGFGKLVWNPSPSLRTFLNAYWGGDGVAIANDSIDRSLVTNQKFGYTNTEVLVSTGAKVLLDDHNLLDLLVSYNTWDFNVNGRTLTNGTKNYDSDFTSRFDTQGQTSFTLNNLTNNFLSDKTDSLIQAKGSWDWEAAPGQVFSFGQETLLEFWSSRLSINGWQTSYNKGVPEYDNLVLDTNTTGQKTLTEGVFALYNFTLVPGTLTGEAGLRIDDSVVFNDAMLLQTQPAANPRVLLTYTPVHDWSFVRSLSLLGGTGLFSQFPFDNQYIDKKYGVSDFSIGPERAWFNELGTEILTQDDWKIDLTGYWKSYFGRFYATIDPRTSNYVLHSDGTGNAWGFDVYFLKHTRFWDTSLAYSFIVSRLYNPGPAGDTAAGGEPLGTWYYPSYQRFHNLSFTATVSPNDGFSITTEAQAASGTPLAKVGPATSYAAKMPDGTIVEIFSRTSAYDDNLRIGWSFPVSVKFAWHDFFTNSKTRWEFYLGVQDIFAALYTKGLQGNPPIDQWYGADLTGTSGASFSSGIPTPSVGLNLGY